MKKISLEDFEKYSFVISCNESRMEIINKAFRREGLSIPKTIHGIQLSNETGVDRRYWHSKVVAAAHLQCVNIAETEGWPLVVIFEDDAWPRKNVKPLLEEELANIPDNSMFHHLGVIGMSKKNGKIRHYGTQAWMIFREGFSAMRDIFKTPHPINFSCLLAVDTLSQQDWEFAENVTIAKTNLFTQMNLRKGTAYYGHTYKCLAHWSKTHEENFPSYEEVMKND